MFRGTISSVTDIWHLADSSLIRELYDLHLFSQDQDNYLTYLYYLHLPTGWKRTETEALVTPVSLAYRACAHPMAPSNTLPLKHSL